MYLAAIQETAAPATFIAGQLQPAHLEFTEGRFFGHTFPTSTNEVDCAKEAFAAGFEPSEWVLDHVVDRMLAELSW